MGMEQESRGIRDQILGCGWSGNPVGSEFGMEQESHRFGIRFWDVGGVGIPQDQILGWSRNPTGLGSDFGMQAEQESRRSGIRFWDAGGAGIPRDGGAPWPCPPSCSAPPKSPAPFRPQFLFAANSPFHFVLFLDFWVFYRSGLV
ncbi:hypothetical protein DV515_00018774 [Chloebia gouldiae]|uniref:Uncharacterized protein n=1 Tax=Chloebia gouldiae TaxID=44316 RepID=A0A3L8Q715_CHLGU|nr:hypothetical protein DV515_00018774 [Chloebia gouldiae]